MYKSVNRLDNINWKRNRLVNTSKVGVMRSTGVKIRRDIIKSNIPNDFVKQVSTRDNYFFNMRSATRNSLRSNIVQTPILKMFKIGLDDRFKSNDRYSEAHFSAKLRCLRKAWEKLLTF